MDIPQERKLVTEIPGPRSQEWFARRAEAVPVGIANLHPIVTARASNAIIEDVDGNRLIDFATGIAVLNVGHAAPEVVAAAQRQLELDTHTCFHVTANEPYIELAERLNAIAPIDGATKTMFANSGAEAVENAVKIARYHTGRDAVITFDRGFHGRTLLTMSLTSKLVYKKGMGPFAPEIYRAPAPYPYRGVTTKDALKGLEFIFKAHVDPQSVACVVLEPVQGEGGFTVIPAEFIEGVMALCEQHGILYVDDEVQSGMGRTGKLWALDHYGLVPDLMTVGKSLAAGMPLAGVIGRAEVMDSVHLGGLGSTYGGNPVACAAAVESIKAISSEAFLAQATAFGEEIMARLQGMADRHPVIGEVRGIGPMAAIELVKDRETREPAADVAAATVAGALERGLLLLKTGIYDNVLRILVPITATEEDLELGLDRLEESLAAAA